MTASSGIKTFLREKEDVSAMKPVLSSVQPILSGAASWNQKKHGMQKKNAVPESTAAEKLTVKKSGENFLNMKKIKSML